MNTLRVITVICWSVSALVLIGLLVWFLTGSVFGIGGLNFNNWFSGINIGNLQSLTGPFENQGSHIEDTTNLHSVSINWVAGEITVIPYDGNEVRVTEFAQRELRDNERMQVTTDGGTLNIRFRAGVSFAGNMPRKNLEVLVPRELSEEMTRLSISTTSGSINVNSFEATTVRVSSVSASIDVSNIISNDVNISTTSGKITTTSVRAGKLDTSSVSGDTSISESHITTLDASTTSGKTNASGEFQRVDVSSVSGSTTIKNTTVPDRINISSVSGSIDVYIPNNGDIAVSHSAVSGRFSSEVPVIMQNGAPFSFSSVSGNTNIHVLG